MAHALSLKTLFRKKSVTNALSDAGKGFSDGHGGNSLTKTLGVWDLTALGIAAVIGAGIFSTVGNASFNGGPAVIFLFLITAVACGLSALCYAEFASGIPVSGSAYTYAYVSFGELLAWIIGWDLVMEYAIGNIAVAVSWSDYFTGLLSSYGIHFPPYLTLDYLSASRAHDKVSALVAAGGSLPLVLKDLGATTTEAFMAWQEAPLLGGLRIICDLPALAITVFVTWLVYVGIKESKRVSNILVMAKVLVIGIVIIAGAYYVKPENWTPFAPNGMTGMLKGISAVFFAYIGFDAISTTAEECKNPQRDLPRAMIYSLLICTVLYALIALVITGIVSYKELQVGDPLAYVFGPKGANLPWLSGVVALSAIIAMTGVLTVFQLGQPRIWMAMSRDGLLPPIFGEIHHKYRTPWFATLITGLVVAIPSLFMNLTEVTDLTSIGTLFAFCIVSGGMIVFHHQNKRPPKGGFRVPYISARFIAPALLLMIVGAALIWNLDGVLNFFRMIDPTQPELSPSEVFPHRIPLLVYMMGLLWLTWGCIKYRLSLIPVLGLASCAYFMTELGLTNWIRFLAWLIVGLALYFTYGRKHSKIARK